MGGERSRSSLPYSLLFTANLGALSRGQHPLNKDWLSRAVSASLLFIMLCPPWARRVPQRWRTIDRLVVVRTTAMSISSSRCSSRTRRVSLSRREYVRSHALVLLAKKGSTCVRTLLYSWRKKGVREILNSLGSYFFPAGFLPGSTRAILA